MVSVYMKLTGAGCKGSKEVRELLLEALRLEYPHLQGAWADGLPSMEKNTFGKPFFLDYPEIYFNLSHTKGCVCCALADAPVGVDVELCYRRANQEQIVKRFSTEERKLWRTASEERRQELFFALWVLKESCVKADGRGLRIPLDAFSVQPGERKKESPEFPYGEWTAQIPLLEGTGLEQEENRQRCVPYHLYLFSPLDIVEGFSYRIAACCEKTGFLGPFLVE